MNYATTLPATPEGSIFVRVPEDRFDLPRILITGPHDTPYANGLFYFDCYLKDYPVVSPNVKFLTTGNGSVRFNPNLYNCGKVCLSLLGTWHGPGWISNSSTLLQVILSIQGLIFGTDQPYYNEPGFENFKGQKRYEQESIRYNKEIRKQTLR
ncbi:UBC-like protein, partial [Fragilariopsis cylindrus CCMP1102]